jgi:aryl-alcohol dehydrogenase-like predicted oxidoreductase/histidinol phosphatase-like enzyme
MRLSTVEPRDDLRAAAVLDAALAAGVTLVDTADVYARDDTDLGHNERLIAAALARRAADPPGAPITVVTKGGLVRDGARWRADGRATHVIAAAVATRERLGGAPLSLHLLHAVDAQVPLATSVRALARLRDDGVARRVGLSNVNRTQLLEALEIVDIAAVEVELGPHALGAIQGGLLALCAEREIPVLAHRPLGGPARAQRLARDRELLAIAERHGATPVELVLAWLRALSPVVIPLPGAGTAEHATSAVRAAGLVLDDDARRALDRRFLGRAAARVGGGSASAPVADPPPDGGEVVILMGMPGAGKSTLAGELVERGYARFNRDERGGTLDKLARALEVALEEGVRTAVLDNTYPTRASRAPVLDAAYRHALPVRCVWLDTPIEQAQVNAVRRLLARYGELPGPGELGRLSKQDPGAFRPTAQFHWRRDVEPPAMDEGFAAVERVPFVRAADDGADRVRALVVDVDDVVRVGRPVRAEDVVLVEGVAEALAAWRAAGWSVVGTAWQPAVGEGRATLEDVAAVDARTVELLGATMEVVTCPHPAGPPVCWCRKPLPGLGLVLERRHRIALARSVHVGRGAADRGFAERLGMRYLEAGALRI